MTTKPEGRLSPEDPNSFARPDIAKVVNIALNWNVDFESKVLDGFVVLTVKKVDPKATQVILDVNELVIKSVTDNTTGQNLSYNIGPKSYVGSKLEIELPESNNEVQIKVVYQTSDKCTALQWLEPKQTASKTHPYLFSQCQAIHCRSIVPCQDTPMVKAPYSAEVSAMPGLTVLMSAIREEEPVMNNESKKVFKFHQKVPIQSYLIAIAVGNIESRRIGPRSHVWSEKEYVDKAAFDFSDTEAMLQTAEKLCGPYVWCIYDILVLPPSFPYGGMENPCLTFATPTLLTGDKSSSDVIAHEIAHSWTGNLVSNKNFEHFWLNEGFTMYNEYKIIGRLHGEHMRHFCANDGWTALAEEIDHLGAENPLTSLVISLDGVDPDDAFSSVPYEKGAAFLWHLEETVGGSEIFEEFLRAYYDHFKYQSIDSYDFKKFFLDYFKDNSNVNAIDWDTWFKAPGMPKIKPNYDQSLAQACTELRKRWVDWDEKTEPDFSSMDLEHFSPKQVMEFLSQLLEDKPLSVSKLIKMDSLYQFKTLSNAEIKYRWIRLGLRSHWNDAVPMAVQMVTEQGRMKYVRPIYRDLSAWAEMKDVAFSTFEKNKPEMMHVAIQGVEHDLKLK